VALLSSAVLIGGASAVRAEDVVSAKVNGVAISQVRVDATFGAFLETQRVQASQLRNPKQYHDLRQQVLDTLIAQELLTQEAAKRGHQAEEAAVKQAIEQAQQGAGSKEGYLQRLQMAGFTEASYEEDVKRRLAVSTMVEKDISAKVAVTDAEIHEFYTSNPSAFTPPEQVHARHILIAVGEGADQAAKDTAKKKADDLLAQIKGGADFAELAKKSSDDSSAESGGDLGPIARGQTVKPFEDAAFALKAGEVSGVVESPFGYHIIKVEERQGGAPVSEESVRDRVRQFLVSRKSQEQLQALVETLRKEGKVEVLE
jgi:peptidyl-prolyl cis-trans isomerase C